MEDGRESVKKNVEKLVKKAKKQKQKPPKPDLAEISGASAYEEDETDEDLPPGLETAPKEQEQEQEQPLVVQRLAPASPSEQHPDAEVIIPDPPGKYMCYL